MRSIPLDEMPDRNTAVSAVKFGLELGATSISKMALSHKPKRKSKLKDKLKDKDSSLKFGEGEAKGENTQAQETKIRRPMTMTMQGNPKTAMLTV